MPVQYIRGPCLVVSTWHPKSFFQEISNYGTQILADDIIHLVINSIKILFFAILLVKCLISTGTNMMHQKTMLPTFLMVIKGNISSCSSVSIQKSFYVFPFHGSILYILCSFTFIVVFPKFDLFGVGGGT